MGMALSWLVLQNSVSFKEKIPDMFGWSSIVNGNHENMSALAFCLNDRYVTSCW